MKLCPDCNERFPDEMKYCDLDGTKLQREPGSEGQDQSRLWSLIGVGVLVGAIVIIAVSVLFSPRTPNTPAIARSTPPASQSVSSDTAAETGAKPEIVVEETPIAEVKKKDKSADATNSNSSAPDPKAAAKEDSDEPEPAKSDPRIEPLKPAASETEKPIASTNAKSKGDGDPSASKSGQTPADAKADKKKESEKGKEEKKDEKKKGGLFRVFKKIFGKG